RLNAFRAVVLRALFRAVVLRALVRAFFTVRRWRLVRVVRLRLAVAVLRERFFEVLFHLAVRVFREVVRRRLALWVRVRLLLLRERVAMSIAPGVGPGSCGLKPRPALCVC